MTDASIIIIYLIAALFVCSLCFLTLRSRRNNTLHPYFLLLASCLLEWIVMNSLFFIIRDQDAALFFHELKFIGVAFTPVTLLLFTIKYMRMEKIFRTNTILLLSLIPLITIFLAATNSYHHLFRQELRIISENPRIIFHAQGIWFWVHTVYSYLLILISMLLIFSRIRKTPGVFRMPLLVMLLGVGVCVLGNAVVVIMEIETQSDISLLLFSISLIFIYWSMINSSMSDYIILAHGEIINAMENAIYILDQDRGIVSMNRAAENLCAQMDVQWRIGQPFPELLELFENNGANFLQGRWNDSTDISIPVDGQNVIYSISERHFTDRRSMRLGTVMTLQNITQIRRLIHSLELTAGFDPLTGIYNRLSYEGKIVALDTPEHLPLAVITGDMNNLKEVNDEFGHEEGDELLRAAAEILTACAPEDAAACRIGGDEFTILIPHCTLQEARRIVGEIRETAAARGTHPYAVLIALGCACKAEEGQNLRDVIHQADMEMYANKEADPDRKKRR